MPPPTGYYDEENQICLAVDPVCIDEGTLTRTTSPTPGPLGVSELPIDEVTPIAVYITNEINRNAHGDDATKLAEMNEFSYLGCIEDFQQLPWWQQLLGLGVKPETCIDLEISNRGAALLGWAVLVMQDAEWDHKPTIRSRFNPRHPGGIQTWHVYGNEEFYYDIWSNIHYGYVGVACGFSESMLLDGAGMEQIGSTLLRWDWPKRSPGVAGMRAFDDASDRESIRIGIRLYQTTPNNLTSNAVLQAVLRNTELTRRSYP
ncbi:MAG: polymorphic toxin type 44 domain-containing protein [Planctomycetota bacterium]|nr:polymorphic toxin type 44 domain-containing protein [Planctomycetota bacterium]